MTDQPKKRNFTTNDMSGELEIMLDVYDIEHNKPDRQLCAWFQGYDQGSDDEPDVTFIIRTMDEDGQEVIGNDCAPLFIVPVSVLRRLCDTAECLYKMGAANFERNERKEPTKP